MPTKPQVFITRSIWSEALAPLTPLAEVEIWPLETPPPHEVLLEKVRTAAALLTMLTDPIDAAVIEVAGPAFKGIAQMAVGFDNIDIAAATRRGFPVGHTPGVLTETTADFAWALLMAIARRVTQANQEVRQGIWKPWGPGVLMGQDIEGATLGLVGFGRIGQAMARRARGFNMRVLYYDLQRQRDLEENLAATYVPFNELLEQSDFVSLHTFLSPETYHLFGREQFARMKPTAYLVNTARGAVVDHDALLWALQESKIAGAALDVSEPEPIGDSPLLKLDNVIVTPHIASASVRTRLRMAHMTVENVCALLNGDRLPYCANPQVYR